MKKVFHNSTSRNVRTREQLRRDCRASRIYFSAALTLAACAALTMTAFASGSDPLNIVNNLSDFIFSILSHDASQRTQGFLCLFGGLMIAFSKEILTTIGAI